jgi:hypothetical protein
MKRCVYCLCEEDEVTTFKGSEHIIPKFLGGRSPFPLIEKNLVCDNCNSVKFSNLETIFKKDSYEGIFTYMLNLEASKSVWVVANNITISNDCGLGDDFFNEIFPFLKLENEKLVIDVKSQLKIRDKNGYQVFTFENLLRIKQNGTTEFQKIKDRLKKISEEDIAIFMLSKDGTSDNVDDFISLLKEYGIDYSEKERKFVENKDLESNKFGINWEFKITNNFMRVVAKIALNYFIYCSAQEGDYFKNTLFDNTFDKVKNFIIKDDCDWREIIELSDQKPIPGVEPKSIESVSHLISFTSVNEHIIVSLSLFGYSLYKIDLGKNSFLSSIYGFGCEHVFNPKTKILSRMNLIPIKAEGSFGLFKA